MAGWKGSFFRPTHTGGTTRRKAFRLWYQMRTGRTRGKQTGIQIQVRVQPEQVAPLDALIADQPDPKPSRPDVMRKALSEHLKAEGYLQQPAGGSEVSKG